jgi:hypothetical protein
MNFLKRIGVALALSGAVLGYSLWAKSATSKEALQAAYVRYAHVGTDEPAKKRIEEAHEASFGQCYSSATKRRSARFDQAKYEMLMDQRLGSPPAIVPAAAAK